MRTVSIHELRTSFPKVEALLNAGEEVWISKRGKRFARILLDTPPPEFKPDFAGRFGQGSLIQPIPTASGQPLERFLKWREEER